MSAKLFKNSRHARRHLSEVFLCIQAVDKKLKPSYLWDAFLADVTEIQMYIEELYLLRLIDHKLNVICIDDNIFVTEYNSLKHRIDSCPSSIDLIDVSKTVTIPSLLNIEEKTKVLKPIIKCSQNILNRLTENEQNCVTDIDCTSCNLSTLFGILLGYPVLYWFSPQSPHSEFTCLSMLPLKVHKIMTDIYLPSDCSKICFNSKSIPICHELFSFSIPENVSDQTDSVVKSWFQALTSKSNSTFYNLKIRTEIITLPSVSM